jgi:hypothetical protein
MTTSATPTTTTAPAGTADDVVTRRLLRCGLAAGPVFLGVAAAQILTCNGFDLTRHPISLLANGDLGWIQIANFVLTGSLVIAFATGLRRALNAQKGGTWGARLLTIFGAGLVLSGVFVADPANGFPLGTPDLVSTPTWHGILHGVGALGVDAFAIACLVLARHFHTRRSRTWTIACIATGLGLEALLADPTAAMMSVRMAAGGVITYTFLAALALHTLARNGPLPGLSTVCPPRPLRFAALERRQQARLAQAEQAEQGLSYQQ